MFCAAQGCRSAGEHVERRLPSCRRPTRCSGRRCSRCVGVRVALIVLPYDFRQALINTIIADALPVADRDDRLRRPGLGRPARPRRASARIHRLAPRDHAGIGFPLAPLIAALAATFIGLVIGRLGAARPRRQARGRDARRRGRDRAVVVRQPDIGGGQAGRPVPQPHAVRARPRQRRARSGPRRQPAEPGPRLRLHPGRRDRALVLVANLRRTSLGQQMLAVRSNERAAAAAGIDVRERQAGRVRASRRSSPAWPAPSTPTTSARSLAERFGALTALGLIAYAFVGGITKVSGACRGGPDRDRGSVPARVGIVVRALGHLGRCCSAASSWSSTWSSTPRESRARTTGRSNRRGSCEKQGHAQSVWRS